ncbi:MAG: hypothetical protein JWP97_6764 [Labilithrix sp.]|nr:hypothetical protein [Labilithrix sp.]
MEMETFEVTQAVLNLGTVYHVRKPRTEPTLYTIRGELMTTTPRFHLLEGGGAQGDAGKAIADLTANFIKTRYEIRSDGKQLGALVFPAVAFKKTLTLTVGEDEYTADGGVFKGVFQCKRADGVVVFEIAKELSFIRDTFLVKTDGTLPVSVALLSAVAIHSRFYDYV